MVRVRLLLVLAAAVLAASLPASAVTVYGTSVGIGDWTGTRSIANGGLNGTGAWDAGPTSLSWNISFANGLYTYSYTFSSPVGQASHLIIELSDFCVAGNGDTGCAFTGPITNPTRYGVFGTYSPSDPGNSNPGLPNPFEGTKVNFDNPGLSFTITFSSTQAPVWGHFYGKDGNAGGQGTNAIWNVGLQTGSDQSAILNFIARPDGDQREEEVPEPGSYVLIGGGLVALALTRRKAAA